MKLKLGVAEAKRNVNRLEKKNRVALKAAVPMPIKGFIKRDNELFATDPKAERDLLNRTFRASEQTMNRVDNQINNIITEGYRSGKGINDIGNQLTKRFDQLASWEARRIARTEVNTSHNTATYDTYKELGMEYTQWIAASDDRTRDSHVEVDGEIIPIGATYSNGLQFPGDMSGPIEEWINCRCSNAPFIIPYGYMAPSFSPFKEEDLIPLDKPLDLTDTVSNATQQGAEATSGNNELIQKFGEINRFKMTPTEIAEYNELKPLFDAGELGFLKKSKVKKYNTQMELHDLHQKLIKEGKLGEADANKYKKLYGNPSIQSKFGTEVIKDTYLLQGKAKPVQPKIGDNLKNVAKEPEIPYAPKTKTINGKTYTNYTDDTSVIMDKQNAQQKKNGYSQRDIDVVHNWGFEGHLDISAICFNVPELKTGLKSDAEIHRDIKDLEKAINKGKGLEEPTTLFRGGEVPEGLKEGDIIEIDGFQSYSFDEDVARDFKEENEDRFLITSHGDKGTKGVHIDDEMFAGLSEDEWLTQIHQKHRVIKVDYEKQTLETEFINDW